MAFIFGKQYLETVAGVVDTGTKKNARCAVAFWGKNAEQFQAVFGRKTQIICNLESGATNPDVIAIFLKAGIPVRTSRTLHAKVYRGTDTAIVGSANCSTNGLSLEEGNGWDEAGVVVTSKKTLAAIDAWLDGIWKGARNVTNADISEARKQWALRRKSRPHLGNGSNRSLIEAMKENPAAFEDRRMYFVITTEDVSPEAEKIAKAQGWASDEFYEDWASLPTDALLIDMGYDPAEKCGEFLGLYRTLSPHKKVIVKYRDKTQAKLTYCPSVNNILGYKLTPADKKYLAARVSALWEGRPNPKSDDDGVALSFHDGFKLLFEALSTANLRKRGTRA